MQIVRLPSFERSVKRLKLADAEIEALVETLADDPYAGDVIPRSEGVRKVRFPLGGKGKRGGGRAIYVVVEMRGALFLILAYKKSDKADLTAEEMKRVVRLVRELKS